MTIPRPIGTMVTYGFVPGGLAFDLAIAKKLSASVVEILPEWKSLPDPRELHKQVTDAGFKTHSAHGCWGGQSIRASRVDLGSLDSKVRRESIDDIKRCIEWLSLAGGDHLVIHPGGLSDRESKSNRLRALEHSLGDLADTAETAGVILCVENMPPGVFPGSQMADLVSLVTSINRPATVGLALDTGHANISANVGAETLIAGKWLRTTHVHDNNGRQDSHLPPGLGTVDWANWGTALDTIEYSGPLMLECIRHLRSEPETISPGLLELLRALGSSVVS